MEQKSGILLESGTNEVEIVEFIVGSNKFGINVIKVKEIIKALPVTPVPQAHPSVEGIIELRGEVLTVINLAAALGKSEQTNNAQDKFIVTEFNKQKIVFHVHNVTKIHRLSWEQIEKPSEMYQGPHSHIIGVTQINKEMVFLLDFEKIVVDVNPHAGVNVEQLKNIGQRETCNKKIVIAEDSPLLRNLLEETLHEAKFMNLEFFENGKEAYDYIEEAIETEQIHLVITDIEMPVMDGLHLTSKIKKTKSLSGIPVLVFSSLITDELLHKCKVVGVDSQVSKPEIAELVHVIDRYIL